VIAVNASLPPHVATIGPWKVCAAIAVAVAAMSTVIAPTEMTRAASSTQMSPVKHRDSEIPTPVEPPISSGAGRRVVFDQSDQRVWLLTSDGSVDRTYLVSGSNRGNVQPGSYIVASRSRHARSYNGNGTFEYFVRFTEGRNAPIGFHSVTVNQQGRYVHAREDLGIPRTPGCVEQWHDDAAALWAFAPVGTPVNVVP
jgi:hypothetical protein